MAKTDNEWAAEVMGMRWDTHLNSWRDKEGQLRPTKHFDTDANDFRDLLNCEAVRGALDGMTDKHYTSLRRVLFADALDDQPTALRRLREVMEMK